MSACCVSGCKNRHSSTSKLKFYRIPSGSRPFQANRRRLWLKAIEQVNGSTEGLKGNARICGAHFKSQQASMDHDSPDFVPSVFTCAELSTKKKVKWFYGRRKRRRRAAKTEEKTTPLRADSPVDLQSSVLAEEIQEGVTLHKEAEMESEITPIKSQKTPIPNEASPSFKAPEGIPKLDKRFPIVLLKHIFVPADGYQCEQCNQSFTNASQLLKHRKLHDEESPFICETCGKMFTSQADLTEHQCAQEPSFPCNMCDRSFATSHNLKRHKLLHVKDGRKCRQCGVLFCQRHNHVLFLPLAESITEYEEDSTTIEPQNVDSNLMPENHLLEEPEPSQTADLDDDAQSATTVSPLPPNHEAPSPASHTGIKTKIPVLVSPKLSSVSCLPPPVPPPVPRNPGTSSQFKPPLSSYPTASVQPLPPPNLELPPSLKLFSPQYLTSALLEVKRNYDYILSKPGGVKNKKDIVKEEEHELPLISPDEQSVERVKKERTAYDLEIVL